MIAPDLSSLLALLRERSIRIRIEDGRLQVRAPEGAVTEEIREQLAQRKADLLAYFSGAGIQDPTVSTGSAPRARLTVGQQALWERHQQSTLEHAFHVPRALRIRGILDENRLERALERVRERHEILRTNFLPGENGPVCRIREPDAGAVPFRVVDLRESEGPEATEWIKAESKKPFDLATDDLLRTSLLRISDRESILVIVAHHLVADCWSLGLAFQSVAEPEDHWHAGLFFESLFAHYLGEEEKEEPSEAEEEFLQFSDFVAWQESFVESPEGRAQEAFGRRVWERPAPKRRFPSPASGSDYSGQRIPFDFPQALSEDLRRAAGEHQTTPYALLFGAFAAVVLNGGEDREIAVNLPVANRRNPKFRSLVGSLGNKILVRTVLAPEVSYLDAVRTLQRDLIESIDHQEFPVELLAQHYDPEGALGEVRFLMQSPADSRFLSRDLEVEPLPLCRGIAKHPLSVTLVDQPGGYRGWGEFLDSCLDEEAFGRIIEAFRSGLALGLDDPTRPIGDLPALPDVLSPGREP